MELFKKETAKGILIFESIKRSKKIHEINSLGLIFFK